MNVCDALSQKQMDTTLNVCSERIHSDFNKSQSSTDQQQFEKDSGIGLQGKFLESCDPLNEMSCVSRRSSTCSSGCSSMPITPNSTVSSAYCSVASSACDSDARSRRKSDVIPQSHLRSAINKNNNIFLHRKLSATTPVSDYSKLSSNTSQSLRRIRAASATSMKSHRVLPEDSSVLMDRKNNRKFEKKRLLGKGGFARVYEVVEQNSKKESSFAAKIIDKSRIPQPQQRKKVDIEIELFAEARGHPNVVSYVDSFEDEHCICILQELCNKKNLAQYLRRKQRLSEPEVCDIMQQIVSGLSHLHQKGILHRDLKLGNVLLSEDMQVKIADFGLATRTRWEKKRTICGTPNFIAPEVLQRQGHGTEADVWALGCLLFTLLVGKPPFEAARIKDTYRCILKGSFRIPSTVSSEAADLVGWMLSHKPKRRPNLTEIVSHSFFKKHSDYLLSVQHPLSVMATSPSHQCCASNDCKHNLIVDTSSTSLSSEEKSLITVKSETGNISLETVDIATEKTCIDCTKNKSVGSPIKSLKKGLQNKLRKVSSPGKCVRAETTTFSEGRKSSNISQPDLTLLKETASLRKTDSNHRTSLSSPTIFSCKTWVSKWVDYSNRYGFGYQLSSGRICVLFNDGKHISMLPGGKLIEYASNEGAKAIRFSTDAIPLCLTKHGEILKNITKYMDKKLRQNSGISSTDDNNNDARMLTWCRTDNYVAMYFNDGTLQVNFCRDHVKINVNNLHKKSTMCITVVDELSLTKAKSWEEEIMHTFLRSTATWQCFVRQFLFKNGTCKTYENEQFISQAGYRTLRKLSSIHQQFHCIFADVDCKAHPFCKICRDASCSIIPEL